ncbi:MAG: hypothetical protein EPO24_00355 [Bacteroidetes bacterium]|nr:MAG: hypothetical protein EPO24_00355 [Bacteroidota bacterium]
MPEESTILLNGKQRGRPHFWWLLSGVWLILSFIMANQLVLRTSGTESAVSWYNAFMLEFFYCVQWVALAPLTLRVARVFPLQSKKFFVGIIVHLTAGALMSAATMGGRTVLNWVFLHHMQTALTWERVLNNMTEALDYGMMSYLLNMFFCYSYTFYERAKEREVRALKLEAELGQAQLQALKMQLHPHFFFNTLNTISVLIRKKENELAVEMIARLSKFLRYTLEKTDTQEVTLAEELNAVEMYLEIQKARFQDKLNVQRAISPDVLNVRVPTLILQPLLENALEHGIAKREQGGVVELSAERVNGAVHIRVTDNGPGINPGNNAAERRGIGLQNTESRLQKLYGGEYGFEISSKLEGGTTVQITLPYQLVK